jgi:ribosomal protein RSM22 (predicted rRNA methylase)
VDRFEAENVRALRVSDRSTLATNFAARRANEKYPTLTVNTGLTEAPAVLLVSHVLTELTPEQIEALADLAATAQSAIWIEPGTYEASLTLISIRERLRGRMKVVAPCTHQERCGILVPENERHWCHHFASPPSEIFTDGNWARFAAMLGIDLRDLPLSFLVLDSRPPPIVPPGATRMIGHPRVYKAHALLLSCDATGVGERRLTKRTFPAAFKQAKKGDLDVLQVMRREGNEIVGIQPF